MSDQAPEQKTSFRRLLELIFPYKGWIVMSVLCMLAYNIFTAAPAFYSKDVVDALAYGDAPKLAQFFLVGAAVILIYFFKGVFYFGQNYSMGLMIQRLVAKLRQQLFDHVIRLSLSFFSKSKTGDLIARFTNDLQVLQQTLTVGVSGPFRDIPQIFLLFGIMVFRSWELALVTSIIIPVTFFFIHLFGKNNKRAVTGRQSSFGDLTGLLVETISGMRVVKAFGMERYESKRFDESNKIFYNRNMESIMIASYATPVIEVIGATAGATILAYGGYLIIHNQITAGDFASFFMSFFLLNPPIKDLNGFNLKLQEGLAAINRVFSIMDTQNDIKESLNPVKLESFKHQIDMDIVKFQYLGYSEVVLKEIHLSLKKGEVLALVGSSGSGKTTLANLIPRFFDVTEGSIKVDGNDLRDMELESLRHLISIVTQETILFNDTVANNISYGHRDCLEDRMIAAAKAANAHQFISNLRHGYQTSIGEKGVLISGGQRQRLAIARAIVKDAPILILDEATSALDSESEIEVQQALENLMQNRTTIVIAHRLSTIRHAHRICVLENGQIVQEGNHESLLEQGGRYKQLYDMQFRAQATSPKLKEVDEASY
ncbi:ABC transporter ATP-binding protein [Deltaproteobacteria bacterium TL4]